MIKYQKEILEFKSKIMKCKIYYRLRKAALSSQKKESMNLKKVNWYLMWGIERKMMKENKQSLRDLGTYKCTITCITGFLKGGKKEKYLSKLAQNIPNLIKDKKLHIPEA